MPVHAVPAPTVTGMSVSSLAERVGVRPDTVRYYERIGLLPPPARTPAEHRRYDETAVDRLQFVQGAQRLGLRLREINDLLAVRDTGRCPCEPAETLLRRRIEEIDAELARLSSLRAELVAMADRLPGPDCPDPAPGRWCPPGTDLTKGGDPMALDVEVCDCECGSCDESCCSTDCC